MSSERRLHPRINTDLPGELELSGNTYDIRVVNLSLGGFLVEGGSELAQLQYPAEPAVMEVDLHFGLEDTPLHCRCRVVYKRRQSYSQIGLGLRILSLASAAEEAIREFVDDNLVVY